MRHSAVKQQRQETKVRLDITFGQNYASFQPLPVRFLSPSCLRPKFPSRRQLRKTASEQRSSYNLVPRMIRRFSRGRQSNWLRATSTQPVTSRMDCKEESERERERKRKREKHQFICMDVMACWCASCRSPLKQTELKPRGIVWLVGGYLCNPCYSLLLLNMYCCCYVFSGDRLPQDTWDKTFSFKYLFSSGFCFFPRRFPRVGLTSLTLLFSIRHVPLDASLSVSLLTSSATVLQSKRCCSSHSSGIDLLFACCRKNPFPLTAGWLLSSLNIWAHLEPL